MAKKTATEAREAGSDVSEMIADAVSDVVAKEVAVASAPPSANRVQRYRVTHYKVRTSQGRKIEGELVELPASEGDAFVQAGQMKLADPANRNR